MIYGKCELCGKETHSLYRSTLPRFCSKTCALKWNWEHSRNRAKKVKRFCASCGKEIEMNSFDQRIKEGQKLFFCDHKCESDYRISHRKYKTCPICGSKFYNRKTLTCSSKCGYELYKMNKFFAKRKIENTGYKDYLDILERESKEKEFRKNQPNRYKGREKEYLKEYAKSHKKERREYQRKRMEEDPVYRYKVYVRKFICHCFRRKKLKKDDRTENVLGCSLEFFKKYIASKFREGMNWDNYGKWQIDHIIPLATAKTKDDVIRLCHYTNLQPLWASENREKSDRVYKPNEEI